MSDKQCLLGINYWAWYFFQWTSWLGVRHIDSHEARLYYTNLVLFLPIIIMPTVWLLYCSLRQDKNANYKCIVLKLWPCCCCISCIYTRIYIRWKQTKILSMSSKSVSGYTTNSHHFQFTDQQYKPASQISTFFVQYHQTERACYSPTEFFSMVQTLSLCYLWIA